MQEFGQIKGNFDKYLKFGIRIMLDALKDHPRARIEWPCQDKEYLEKMADSMRLYAPGVEEKLKLKPVGWLDCVRFTVPKRGDYKKQNEDYSRDLRKMLILFDPWGRAVCAIVNSPGKWHDSKVCARLGLYDIIDKMLDGYCILADSAFRGHIQDRNIIRILKEGERLPPNMSIQEMHELEADITRARQPSEGGITSWCNSFAAYN
jgi:hypothetical protein